MTTSEREDEQATPPADWRIQARNGLLVMGGLVAVVCLMFSGYSSGFGDPKPHEIPVAVVGAQSDQRMLDDSPALDVRPAGSVAEARTMILDRDVYGALDVSDPGRLTLFVANGAGHSVEQALSSVGTELADVRHETLRIEDLAPTSPDNPNGTIEFYGIVFLAIGSALGATVLSRVLGPVKHLKHLGSRLLTLTAYSFALALSVSFFADIVLGAVVGHFGLLLLALWGFTLSVCLAASGVSALFGPAAGVALTLTFTIVGNTSAGGAVGRPLLNGFYAAMTPIFPHGAGVNIVRGVEYFGGRGIAESVLCLCIWAAIGLTLLVVFAFRQGRRPVGRHEQTADEHDATRPAALDAVATPAAATA